MNNPLKILTEQKLKIHANGQTKTTIFEPDRQFYLEHWLKLLTLIDKGQYIMTYYTLMK